nr:ABC transporter substrate-binding protein [Clostridium sp. D53t1_180928_C8]
MSKFLKKLAVIVGVVAIVGATFAGCQKTTSNDEKTTKENINSEELQTVRLNEVVRSVFYAPMYVAISEGFFEEEGLKIDLSTGQGADTTYFK